VAIAKANRLCARFAQQPIARIIGASPFPLQTADGPIALLVSPFGEADRSL
jgi:hypothetical protein